MTNHASPVRRLARLAAVAALSLGATAGLAGAQNSRVLDFEELATPTTPEFGIPSPIITQGFVLQATGGTNDFNVWGYDEGNPSYAGSTALFANTAGARVDLYTLSGTPFNLFSMNIAPLYATSDLGRDSFAPFTVRFFGFLPGSSTSNFFQDFVIATPGSGSPTFTPILFDARWRGLDGVAWQQQSVNPPSAADPYQWQFDDVAVAVVPEPGTVLLLATGLFGLGAARVASRRRSRASIV